jgi:hypothetical protein
VSSRRPPLDPAEKRKWLIFAGFGYLLLIPAGFAVYFVANDEHTAVAVMAAIITVALTAISLWGWRNGLFKPRG